MSFEVLDAEGDGLSKWLAVLAALPQNLRDIHFNPAYLRAYAREGGWQAKCALLGVNGDFILQPFILKADEIACAYGYGGPLANRPTAILGLMLANDIAEWCVERGVSREYFRLHPFLQHNHQSILVAAEREKQVAWVDLTEDIDGQLRKGHRHSVKVAERSGVDVYQSNDLDLFLEMYRATMKRFVAEPRFWFDRRLLEDLREGFNNGRFRILVAKVEGHPEAACLMLGDHGTCYYHYAASYGLYRQCGVGTMLVLEASRWAKAHGYKRFHLGGGTSEREDDPLFQFKSGFSHHRAWVYRRERTFSKELAA